jgi:hypothetical protein
MIPAVLALAAAAILILGAIVWYIKRSGTGRLDTTREQFDTDVQLQKIVDAARNDPTRQARLAELRRRAGRHRRGEQ